MKVILFPQTVTLSTSLSSSLQHTAAHCNTQQHTAAHLDFSVLVTLSLRDTHCNTLQHATTHCSTLQHAAANCTTLQHTAAHCSTPRLLCPHHTSSETPIFFPCRHRRRNIHRPTNRQTTTDGGGGTLGVSEAAADARQLLDCVAHVYVFAVRDSYI